MRRQSAAHRAPRAMGSLVPGGFSETEAPQHQQQALTALRVPARRVEAMYQALAGANCIPRRWHPEGRDGVPIVPAPGLPSQRLLPLLTGGENRHCGTSVCVFPGLSV